VLPRRFKIHHRFLPRRRVAAIIRTLRHPRRDRPEPAAIFRCRVRPHDPADVAGAVEHVVVVVRPGARGLPTNGREAFPRLGPNLALFPMSRWPMPRSETIRRRP
jgi:hypothetical protein